MKYFYHSIELYSLYSETFLIKLKIGIKFSQLMGHWSRIRKQIIFLLLSQHISNNNSHFIFFFFSGMMVLFFNVSRYMKILLTTLPGSQFFTAWLCLHRWQSFFIKKFEYTRHDAWHIISFSLCAIRIL